ncbi:hypothetical protein [Streptosporangium sp. CA-115845]|uniref:hypothetical protein n=1 Tax=Streptosporangium sp. CA-115845 TaxID=3240071 RepID=UPI003D901A91
MARRRAGCPATPARWERGGTVRGGRAGFGSATSRPRRRPACRSPLRYRLARLEQVSGYRLDDPDDRVVMDLRLRLWRRAEPGIA